jgi:hypothetical protein
MKSTINPSTTRTIEIGALCDPISKQLAGLNAENT